MDNLKESLKETNARKLNMILCRLANVIGFAQFDIVKEELVKFTMEVTALLDELTEVMFDDDIEELKTKYAINENGCHIWQGKQLQGTKNIYGRTGELHPMYKNHHSEETRQKISKSLKRHYQCKK